MTAIRGLGFRRMANPIVHEWPTNRPEGVRQEQADGQIEDDYGRFG